MIRWSQDFISHTSLQPGPTPPSPAAATSGESQHLQHGPVPSGIAPWEKSASSAPMAPSNRRNQSWIPTSCSPNYLCTCLAHIYIYTHHTVYSRIMKWPKPFLAIDHRARWSSQSTIHVLKTFERKEMKAVSMRAPPHQKLRHCPSLGNKFAKKAGV